MIVPVPTIYVFLDFSETGSYAPRIVIMFVDVLKRYLLMVWNFFFGQVSAESIKDSSPSCTEDKPADSANVVPPVEVDDNHDKIENGDDEDDDIIEIFDDDEEDDEEGEELELENEDEIEEDQDEKAAIVPKKPEEKVIRNDAPTKPSVPTNKTEEVKVPTVLPKPKEEIKKPEPSAKAPAEIGEKEKSKIDIDNAKKAETPAKLKPEFETGERDGASTKAVESDKDSSKFKSEFEIVEREDRDVLPPKPKTEFEVVERGTAAVKPVLPPPPPPPSSSAVAIKDDANRPAVNIGGDDKDALKPAASVKAAAHVKFQEDYQTSGNGSAPVVNFAALEKGEIAVSPPGATTGNVASTGDAVEDFLSAEQAHGGQLLMNRHHESIQDQQL